MRLAVFRLIGGQRPERAGDRRVGSRLQQERAHCTEKVDLLSEARAAHAATLAGSGERVGVTASYRVELGVVKGVYFEVVNLAEIFFGHVYSFTGEHPLSGVNDTPCVAGRSGTECA